MGVMSCSRSGCSNIMCDTYVEGVGYVCKECQAEFKEFVNRLSEKPETEGQLQRQLKIFMDTEAGEFKQGNAMDVNSFFRKYTRD